jgi:hypothetical protein
MAQKAVGLCWALFGLAFVVGLTIAGIDAARSIESGPRWKRRLLTAGIMLMTALGFSSCLKAKKIELSSVSATEQMKAQTGAVDLQDDPAWNQIAAAWKEAEEIGSFKRGAYPFDRAGKWDLLNSLEEADANLLKLQYAGKLGKPEMVYLGTELQRLSQGVQGVRTTEELNMTCYMPGFILGKPKPLPSKKALNYLQDRLLLVQKMTESNTLNPAVAAKVTTTMLRDIEAMNKIESSFPLSKKDHARAVKVKNDAEEALKRISPDI